MKKRHSCSFLAAHFRRILLRLVLETAKVEQSVSENPKQFFIESHPEDFGIFAHPFHTDIDIAVQEVTLHIVERDNVGEGIVLQILEIELEQIVVVTKDVIDVAQLFTMSGGQGGQPLFIRHLLTKLETGLGVKKYHNEKFRQKYRNLGKCGSRRRKKCVFLQPETGLVVQWIERKFPKL